MATIDNKRIHKKKARKGGQGKPKSDSKTKDSHLEVDSASHNKTTSNETTSTDAVTSQSSTSLNPIALEHNTLSSYEVHATHDNVSCHDNEDMCTSPEPDPLASNPYLNREKCLLCQRNRTEDDDSDSEDEELKIGPHNYALSQMSLWVCCKCKTTLEEEERKGEVESNFFNDPDPSTLKFLSEIQYTRNNLEEVDLKTCECEACKDRRQIESEQDVENNKLQLCWTELLHAIRCVYRENKKCLIENGGTLDREKCKQHVARLCARDSHQLFQRLESHSIDYILEVKVRLMQQLTTGHNTPEQAKAIVSMMLEEYNALCTSAKILSDIFKQLENEHLKRFVFNWELHDRHLFRNIVYADSVLVSAMPMLITQLRLGAASKEAYVEDSYPSILHKYLKFDDDMSVVNAVWRDCQMRLDQYTDEQAAIQAKQRMLREDWEFFSAQRKILKDQIMKNNEKSSRATKPTNMDSPIPSPPPLRTSFESLAAATASGGNNKCAESQFSDAMRNLLEGSTAKREPFTCPNCKKQRCPCHECSISHLITCGILAPELQDTLLPMGTDGNCGASTNPFTITPSSLGYDISVKAPSFSSTDSSSDGDSDGPGSGYASTDSWDEKLKLNPNINLFEEFLKDAAREPILLKNEDEGNDLDTIAPNNLSDPSPCQCHECKKPLCLNTAGTAMSSKSNPNTSTTTTATTGQSSAFSSTVPASNIPKPAALHLYPHIHGSRTGSVEAAAHMGAARVAAGGSLSAAHSLMQPQLYHLHNNSPLNQQSQLVKQHFEKLKQKKVNLTFNTSSSDSPTVQPCLKDQLKSKHTCTATEQSIPAGNPLSGIDTTQYFSSLSACANYKFPDVSSYTNTTRINQSDLLSAPPPPPFNPSAFSLDSMITANVPLISNSASRATTLHSWQMMKQQVLPSCLQAYPNAADSETPHEHTEECFKHLLGPINHTSKVQSKVKGELASRFVPVCSAATSTPNPVAVSSSNQIHVPSDATVYPVTNCGSNSIQQQPVSTLTTTKTKTSNIPTCQHSAAHKTKTATSTATNKSHDLSKSNPKTERRHHTSHQHQPSSAASQQSAETDGGCSPTNSDDEDGDSCSGQSSSTSTSNQKDSKYCDCCYCEFFGHGQPAPAPTSKNFAEIRDRLRLRLKKKQKQNPCSKGHDAVPISAFEAVAAATTPSVKSAAILAASQAQLTIMDKKVVAPAPAPVEKPTEVKRDTKQDTKQQDYPAVEDLLKFITGEEVDASEVPKLDKKQRKKLKKAEQKAKRLEQAKRLPRADSRSSVANSDSDGDSDSDKIIAQLQTKSSRHQQTNRREKTGNTPSAASIQHHQSKKSRDTKNDSPKRNNSSSPDNDKTKSKSVKSNVNNSNKDSVPSNRSPQTSSEPADKCDGKVSRSGASSAVDEQRPHALGKEETSLTQHRQQPDGQEDLASPQQHINRPTPSPDSPQGQRRRRSGRGENVDDVFMPIDAYFEQGSFENELNEFKKFVLTPGSRKRVPANVNVKELQVDKKKGVAC